MDLQLERVGELQDHLGGLARPDPRIVVDAQGREGDEEGEYDPSQRDEISETALAALMRREEAEPHPEIGEEYAQA